MKTFQLLITIFLLLLFRLTFALITKLANQQEVFLSLMLFQKLSDYSFVSHADRIFNNNDTDWYGESKMPYNKRKWGKSGEIFLRKILFSSFLFVTYWSAMLSVRYIVVFVYAYIYKWILIKFGLYMNAATQKLSQHHFF